MADKKNEEFTVADRRRFSFEDGEIHDNPERAQRPEEKASESAKPLEAAPQETKKAEIKEFPKKETVTEPEAATDTATGQQHPPLSEADKKAGDTGFAQASKAIDDQIRAQLGRKAEDFQMSFDRFVASLYMTALMQMGLLHEQGGQPRVDLLGARQTIDTLVLIRDKTKGNLTPQEENLLSNSLYEVQMAYVEVTNAVTRQVQPAPPGAVPNPFVKK
ncbi:MAG TPA: DUF1844 domain-containing protein [Terriglobales bacterium]|nr:DUF1844 domain-containing protein [Terriglobales bacterium]